MPTFSNTFVGGMAVDFDEHIQKNPTYRFAIGARLLYNKSTDPNKTFQENIKDGVSLAIVVAKGNKFEIAICNGYKFVGSVDTLDGTVLFTTNGINSEIGIIQINRNIFALDHVTYTVLFNDRNDPNFKNNIHRRRAPGEPGGDLLNFSEQHYIHGWSSKENEFIHRVYWVDGYNQKRVINLPLFYQPNGEPYHPRNASCDANVAYPKHMSVHAMDDRMDLVFPKMKFQKSIKGQLKSGMYQILVQYVSKNGHSSVWSYLTTPGIWVSDQKLHGVIDGDPNAYKSNHHNRTMGPSNIMTEEGLRFVIQNIDTRWDSMRIAYVFHATSTTFQEANVFKTVEIGNQDIMVIDLDKNTGTGITAGQINQRFETIMSVGTTAQQENRSWDGNIELLPEMTLDLSSVIIKPLARYYRPDDTVEPKFLPLPNKVSGRNDNDPITNTFVKDKIILINNFTGNVEDYMIDDDYENYKGQQFSHLFRGYMRGETYSFAFLWMDRKGNPLFVMHIKDFTFPNMFDTKDENGAAVDWTLSRKNEDGKFDFRIMGVTFSNIELPVDKMYDKFGKLNVSGFKIVRTQRVGRIRAQGILVNCNGSVNGKTENIDDDVLVHPMPYWDNSYSPKQLGNAGLPPNCFIYMGVNGSYYNRNVDPDDPRPDFSISPYFNFHSPDFLIERAFKEGDLAGQVQKVGFCHKAYSEAVDIFSAHYYTKCYRTLPLLWTIETDRNKNGRPKLGDTSRIKLAIFHDKGPRTLYEKFDPETSNVFDYRPHVQAFLLKQSYNSTQSGNVPALGNRYQNDKYAWKATQQPGSLILKLLDFKAIDTIEEATSRTTYPIVNWKVTPEGYYQNEDSSSLETRQYISTGHFQPITDDILEKMEKKYDSAGKLVSYVVNGAEVWGGDTYVNPFDFTRMYPEYSNCQLSDNAYPDYSSSLIVPNESKYNIVLRYGRSYAANCVMPQRTSCTGENAHLNNGVMPEQPEDWNYNDVLLLEESVKKYTPKPAGVKIVTKMDAGIRWSPKKINGELEDSYRQQLTADYSNAEGSYGAIQKFAQALNGLYVVQEKAFGLMETSLRSFIPTENGDQIYVKSGDVFGGVRYHSRKYGSQHKNSIWSDGNDLIGFVDAREGKIMVFSQAGLDKASESDQMNDPISEYTIYFDQDIIHDQDNERFIDIITGYDNENSEVMTTFHRKTPAVLPGGVNDRANEIGSNTLIYDRNAGLFHGYSPLKPYIYINSGRFLLTPNPKKGRGNELFLCNHGKYGQYFGDYYDTEIEFIVDPQPNVEKIFDNGFVNVNKEGYHRISKIIHEADGNVHTIICSESTTSGIIFPDRRVIFTGSLLRFPMYEKDWNGLKSPLQGHVMKVKIIIDNSQQIIDGKDTMVAITNFDTNFRLLFPHQYSR